jgi:hypothetical protein
MLVQIWRAPGLGDEAFYGRWENVHGDIVRRNASATGIIDYVQSHRIPSAAIEGFRATRGWREPSDGMAAIEWPDMKTMLERSTTPEAARAGAEVRADELLFTERSRLLGMMAKPEIIFDHLADAYPTESPVKMVIEVWRRPDMSPEAFSDRWRGAHADLAREVADAMGFVRYVQNHSAQDFPFDLAEARGWRPSPDGISELWWASEDAMAEALASPEAAEASARLAADESAFVHAPLMSAFLSTERHIICRSSATIDPNENRK